MKFLKGCLTMLYQFISFPDGTEINYSEIITKKEKKEVRIYIEQWNETINDFNSLELYLPQCNVTKLKGFSKDVADKHIRHIKNLKDVIWECAQERDGL